jgi:hypothetical protein
MHDDAPLTPASEAMPFGKSDALPQTGRDAPPAHPAHPVKGADKEEAETHLGGIPVGSPLIRGALLNSFRDGIAANGMLALTDTFGACWR